MAATQSTTDEIEPLDDRDIRALTSNLSVLDNAPEVRDCDDLYLVVSERAYLVDAREGACECWDDRRTDRPRCKHVRRVEYETGKRPIPAWIDRDAINYQFRMHLSTDAETEGED